VLLLFSLVVGEHLHGIFDALGGGDWFTGSSLAAFLGAIGLRGAIVKQVSGSTGLAVLGGAVLVSPSGGLVAYGMVKLRRGGHRRCRDHERAAQRPGRRPVRHPGSGLREIRVTRQGQMMKLNAKSAIPS